MSAAAFRRFAFAYGTAFAVLYVVALAQDLALFTVYPSFGIVLLGTHHSKDIVDPAIGFAAPAMYWYGWTATAAIGALILDLAANSCPNAGRTGLVGMVVGGSHSCDDCVRLPHTPLVPTLAMPSSARRSMSAIGT